LKYLAASKHFQKQLKKLHCAEQEKVLNALKSFLAALRQEKVPTGYGFKKINGDKYEIRVDIRTRIVLQADGDTLVCHLVGDHESVRRYLREYRNK
jgi:mRNA-degrading endonuclease RelE of RelBE toxin-antitoxin system